MPLEEKTASRIKAVRPAPRLKDESAWPAYFTWLKKIAEEFAEVFGRLI